MIQNRYDLQTDTHLSKDFNKILQDCMVKCNSASLMIQSKPHISYLRNYYGTINIFFKNTFHLFGNINWKDDTLMKKLISYMITTKNDVEKCHTDLRFQTKENYQSIVNNLDIIHMMIMYGLQKRNMLVRMSETEPRGAESIEHWKDKTTFKKGDLKIKRIKIEDVEEQVI